MADFSEKSRHLLFKEGPEEALLYERLLKIKSEIYQMTEGWEAKWDDERRSFGACIGISNDIIRVSKKAMKDFRRGKRENFEYHDAKRRELWEELMRVSQTLPEHKSWRFPSDAGQEVVEYHFFCMWYGILSGKPFEEISIERLTPEDLFVTRQAWLRGYADAFTELGKALIDLLLEIPHADRRFIEGVVRIRQRFITIADEIVFPLLDEFELTYRQIIDTSDRPGFSNTFRGLLFRVSHLILAEKKELVDARLRLAEIVEREKYRQAPREEDI